MASRASNRSQLTKLTAFVRAWDEFIVASQKANAIPVHAEERRHAAEVAKAKQAEVQRARNAIGAL